MSIFSQETGYPKSVHGPQSRVSLLESRDALLKSVQEFSDKFKSDVPRPPIGLVSPRPDYWEFWQGHEGRLHDRWALHPAEEGWISWRLFP